MANTRELAQFASFVDFTGSSIGFSTQFTVSGISTFTNKVIFDSTNSIQIPVGTEGQKESVGTAVTGQIRFNSTNQQFEGFGAGNNWGPLGGIKDVDGDTLISAESSAGADEDKLEFITANSTRVAIDSTGKVGIGSTIPTVTLDVVGNTKISGVLTATTFSGSLATTDLTGTITNDQLAGSIANDKLAGSIANDKLANSTVSYGGVSLSLGGSDATPAFDLQDATGYPFTSLTGITTVISGDTTPTLGGNLDANSKDITGVNNLNVSSASTFSGPISVGDTISLGDDDRLRFGDGNDLQIFHNANNNNSVIKESGGGALVLAGTNVHIKNAQSSELKATFNSNGSVDLYYDNSKKFATTGIGVSILSGAGLTATIAGPPNLVIDPGTVGDNTGNVRIKGDLFVDGTTTQINSTALEISDFIVGIATTATTDALADGAGIQIGPSGNTFLYDNTNEAFTSTENLNVASGHTYKIAGTDVLSNDTLGSNVVSSSLTSVGTLTGLTVSSDVSIADKIVHTGDTDTAIRFPAADTFTVETAGSERFRIDSDSKILVGIKTARENLANNESGVEAQFQIEGTSYTSSTLSVIRNSADENDGGIILGKTRSPGTYGNASVVAGDDLGSLTWAGSDGTSLQFGAEIVAEVQSGVGNDDLPTDLLFKTNPGTTNTTERLRITSGGNVGIKTTHPNNTLTVGDTIQPSYAPSSAGNYIEIARTSGADAGLLINKNTGQWLIGIDNSDGANAPLKFEYGAAGSAHPGFGSGTLGMIIKHDGKIGIGTDAPDAKLEVRDDSSLGIIVRSNATQATDTNKALRVRNNSDTNTFHVSHKGQGYFASSVGIGTDNPSAKLDIRGQSNTNFEALTLRNTHGNGASQGQVDLNFDVITTTNQVARSRIRGQESTSDAPYSELTFWTSETTSTEPTKRVTISKTGGVLIGEHTTAVDGGNAPNLEIVNTSTSTLTLARNDTSISSGNDIAAIRVWGNDSNGTYQQCAEILAEADGDHANDDKPTALSFKVSADNSATPVERLRIASGGQIGIGTTGTGALVTIQGDSNEVTAPSIRLLDGTDTREVSITNTAGDFAVSTHGDDDVVHGQVKIFESGIISLKNGGASGTIGERLRVKTDGRIAIGTVSDYSASVTDAPVYISMKSNITAIDDNEGSDTYGLVRIEETGSNNSRFHGIELRNRNSGDIRILNEDVGASNKGDLIVAMYDGGAAVGLHRKIRFNSDKSSIQISGKGGAVAANTSTQHTDIYLATKTGLTAVDTGAGGEVAGLIRFEDIGTNNSRYHGLELRNKNFGDVRILNLDSGTTNTGSMVFAVDNDGIFEAMRISSAGNLEIGTVTDAGNGLRNVDIQNINTGSSAGAIMRLITSQSDGTGTTSADFVKYKTGGLLITNNENNGTTGFIAFNTAESGGSATERLRITSAGNLQRPKSLSQEVSTSVSSTSATSCGSFAKATYRSAYVIAQITQGSSYQVGRYLVIHDGTTATTIEESAIATGDMLGTFSGVVSGSNVEFRVTMSSASSATVITKIESIVV